MRFRGGGREEEAKVDLLEASVVAEDARVPQL